MRRTLCDRCHAIIDEKSTTTTYVQIWLREKNCFDEQIMHFCAECGVALLHHITTYVGGDVDVEKPVAEPRTVKKDTAEDNGIHIPTEQERQAVIDWISGQRYEEE